MGQISNLIEVAEVIASKFDEAAGAHLASAEALDRLSRLLGNVSSIANKQLKVADSVRDASGLFEPGSWVPIYQTAPNSREYDANLWRARKKKQRHVPTVGQDTGNDQRSTTIEEVQLPQTLEREPPPASASRARRNGSLFYIQDTLDKYEEITVQISQTSVKGYPDSLTQIVKARVYPNFGSNVISQNLAQQLGLTITVPIDNDYIRVIPSQAPSGVRVRRSVGRVLFDWHTDSHTLNVTCSVLEQDIVPGVQLVVGKPYIQQVEAARKNSRGESSRARADS